MSEIRLDSVPEGSAKSVPHWVNHVFWGSVAGLAIGLITVFLLTTFHGGAMGLSPSACVALGCTMTLLLSQPAGIVGMIAGAAIGAVVGGAAHRIRHQPRAL
ncbi:MAG: hypothetical protein IPP91_07260 [Betaproteobacteria bacterium]|nr:hypothetical protein [Betaproteobacteria bacterium]